MYVLGINTHSKAVVTVLTVCEAFTIRCDIAHNDRIFMVTFVQKYICVSYVPNIFISLSVLVLSFYSANSIYICSIFYTVLKLFVIHNIYVHVSQLVVCSYKRVFVCLTFALCGLSLSNSLHTQFITNSC